MCLLKLPPLVLDICEEFIKNIVFCMTEYFNTKSLQYFKLTEFHYLHAQYLIWKFSSANIISMQLVQ